MLSQFELNKGLKPGRATNPNVLGEELKLVSEHGRAQGRGVNLNYEYEDVDILGILGAKLRKLKSRSVFMPDFILGNCAPLNEYLIAEKLAHKGERKLLIPYNVVGCHWLGIVISINEYQRISSIICIDSLGNDNYLDLVANAVRQAYKVYPELAHQEIETKQHWIQEDAVSCGPLTIENLLAIANQEPIEKGVPTEEQLIAIRLDHLTYYTEFEPAFQQKQESNVRSIASFSQQHEWLKEAGTHLNAHEQECIVELIQLIENMEMPDLARIFAPTEDESAKEHLDRIRATLLNVREKIDAKNKTHFTNFLCKLIYIDREDVDIVSDLTNRRFKLDYEAIKLIDKGLESCDHIEIMELQNTLAAQFEKDQAFLRLLIGNMFKNNSIDALTKLAALKKVIAFAGPITIVNYVNNGLVFVNMIMLARVDKDTLAASNLLDTSQLFIIFFTGGAIYATSTVMSRTKIKDDINLIFKKSLLFSLSISPLTIGLMLSVAPLLGAFGIHKSLTDIVQSYFYAYAWGVPANFLFLAAQQVALGTDNVSTYAISSVGNSVLTSLLSYLLIFGKLGARPLGAAGLGHGNSISWWVSFIILGFYLKFGKAFKSYSLTPFSFNNMLGRLDIAIEMIKIGVPIGIQLSGELLSFPISSFMIGKLLGGDALSASQIVTQYIYLALTPVYAIYQGCIILVGNTIREENYYNTRLIGNVSILTSLAASGIMLILMGSMPKPLSSLFIDINDPNNANILNITRGLLLIGGGRQLLDSCRLIAGSALQGGFKDTTVPMVAGILGTCIIALPLGYALAIPCGMGAAGIYLANGIGVGLAGVLICHRWHKKATELLRSITNEPIPFSRLPVTTVKPDRLTLVQEEKINSVPQPLLLSYNSQRALNLPRENLTSNSRNAIGPDLEKAQEASMRSMPRKSRCTPCVIL